MQSSYAIPGIPGVLMHIFLVGIILGFFFIGWRFWTKRDGDPIVKRALETFFFLFVLSGVAGFVPRMFHFPDWAFVLIHGLLFAVTCRFIAANQVEIIAESMRQAKYEGRLAARKKMEHDL